MASKLEGSKKGSNYFTTIGAHALNSSNDLRGPGNIISIKNYLKEKKKKDKHNKTYECKNLEARKVNESTYLQDSFQNYTYKDLVLHPRLKNKNRLLKSKDISKSLYSNMITKQELTIPKELKWPNLLEKFIKNYDNELSLEKSLKNNYERYQRSVKNHKIYVPMYNEYLEDEDKLPNFCSLKPRKKFGIQDKINNYNNDYIHPQTNSDTITQKYIKKTEESPFENYDNIKPIYNQNSAFENSRRFYLANSDNLLNRDQDKFNNINPMIQNQDNSLTETSTYKYLINQRTNKNNYQVLISDRKKMAAYTPMRQQSHNFEGEKNALRYHCQPIYDYNKLENDKRITTNSSTEITNNNFVRKRESTPRNERLTKLREAIKNKHSLLNERMRNFKNMIKTGINQNENPMNLMSPGDMSQVNEFQRNY